MTIEVNPFQGGGGGGAVDSVNGQTGTVILTTSNITEGSRLYFTTLRGQIASGAVTHGTVGAPITVAAGGSLATLGKQREVLFLASTGGAVTLGGTQIAAGTLTDQELLLVGTSTANSVTATDGAGLLLNGPCTLVVGGTLYLVWNGTVWVEISRNDMV